MSFPVQQGPDSERTFPPFTRPQVVGYFSLKGRERQYAPDLSQLKYYVCSSHKRRRVHFNLSEGLNRVIRKPDNLDEKLHHLLVWLINNYTKIVEIAPESRRWLIPDFICYRGLITKIVSTPYEDRDGWIICAGKLHGSIYLCAFDTDEQIHKTANLTDIDRKFMSWGYKFEQFLLRDTPKCPPDSSKPNNEAEEFSIVCKSKIGDIKLLYAAETDGICSDRVIEEPVDFNDHKFIELKTTRVVRNKWHDHIFRKKLLKWWCQSFIVGIEDVVCGTRDEKGIVFELDDIKVSDLPKMSKGTWNPNGCMNFCNEFLSHIKTVVTRDYEDCIYKFEHKLGCDIEMEIVSNTSQYAFLPDWFIEQTNKIVKTS